MTVEEALFYIATLAPHSLANFLIPNKIDSFRIAEELLRFINAQGFSELGKVIPGLTKEGLELSKRRYVVSLYGKYFDETKDGQFEVLVHFKNTLPQVYADLLLNGEVLEARLRQDAVC